MSPYFNPKKSWKMASTTAETAIKRHRSGAAIVFHGTQR